MLNAMDEHLIYNADKTKRVRIFQSSDGSFRFEEETYSHEPLERCWLPITKGRSIAVCDSFEIALREARGRIDWLCQQ
jgi:hypothetical protein